jgi:hypothetical protein
MPRQIVTIGTDGFRDYVRLPDGRVFNLGTVSILNFVVELARNAASAKRALDTFLDTQEASLAVDIEAMQVLLAPRRARWAVHDNGLIPPVSRTPLGTGEMTSQPFKLAFESRLFAIESQIATLDHVVKAKVAGNVRARHVSGLIENVRALIGLTQMMRLGPAEVRSASTVEELASQLQNDLSGQKDAHDQAVEAAQGAGPNLGHELRVYLDNEDNLLRERTAFVRKMASGPYNEAQATSMWRGWVNEGAARYAAEFGGEPFKLFSSSVRETLARELEREFRADIESGAVLATEQEPSQEEGKQAGGEDERVNTALAESVLLKVDQAHGLVQASRKKSASVAMLDLHRISDRLAALAKTANLSDPRLRPALLDLASKADHVLSHFAR